MRVGASSPDNRAELRACAGTTRPHAVGSTAAHGSICITLLQVFLEIENTNGIFRSDMPNKTEIADYSPHDIEEIAWAVNSTPRQCLGFKTPWSPHWSRTDFWTAAEYQALCGEWTGQPGSYCDGLPVLRVASIKTARGSKPSSARGIKENLEAWSLSSNASSETKQGSNTSDTASQKHYQCDG